MPQVRTLILGGGLSGLSCAYHLKNDYALMEQGDEPGGLAGSVTQDGFVFDFTGHLLHLRHPYTLRLIPELLGDNLSLNQRRAWIFSYGHYTRYPYQANLFGLPKNVIRDCLMGLIAAKIKSGGASSPPAPETFKTWVLRTFGQGFAKHFFFPYNEKLWTVPPDVLTADWVAPFVPKPSLSEVMTGAFTDQTKAFGYNASFYYPKVGGIQSLASAFVKNLKTIRLGTRATAIDLTKKEVTLHSGETVSYENLVTTLPLVEFLRMASPLPSEIHSARQRLRWSSVYNINLGVRQADLTDKSWIYFPEGKYPFYRIGFPVNFSPAMAPPGHSSMYIEIAHAPGQIPNEAAAMENTLQGLQECGLLRHRDTIVARKVLRIPVAYVTYDRDRPQAAATLLRYLESQKIYSIGRYGAWKYSYMEEAILDGKAAAERILGS